MDDAAGRGGPALLEVERVSKAFGGVRAVREVSFALREGEVLGVMGPNGSGKTTLFNLIGGALRPDAGRIRLAGQDLTGQPPHRITAAGIARTFQHVRPFLALTALENVLVGRLYGRGRTAGGDPVAEARRLLGRVGLEARAEVPAARLSVMDRKRLELARALATAPRILLLDEFMAGLTPAETGGTMALIRGLRAEGVTVMLVEHIVWALLDLSDRIVVLSAGEKIAEGPPAAVAGDPVVIDAYLGRGGREETGGRHADA
ncbi:MAG: ABC transporter ATP-binding protein [Candidatus Rokubacteria bacterium]|nr:ABC transporter ATP-binding protein [Candidatus Rokubacteria bacterium]